MKKLICVFLLLLQFVLIDPLKGIGQNYVSSDSLRGIKETYIGIGGGVSLAPERLFHSHSNGAWIDYPKTGYTINLNGRLQISHYQFGIILNLGYYSNAFDINKYLNFNTQDVGSTVTSLSYSSFTQVTPLIGGSYIHSFGRLSVDLRVLLGIDFVTLPNTEVDVHASSSNPEYTNTYIYTATTGFAVGGGISASYPINRSLSASVGVNFVLASAHYNTVQYKDYSLGVNYRYDTFGSTANLDMMNMSLGLNYGFGK